MPTPETITLTDFLLARITEDEAAAQTVHDVDCDWIRQGLIDPTFGWTCTCFVAAHSARSGDERRP